MLPEPHLGETTWVDSFEERKKKGEKEVALYRGCNLSSGRAEVAHFSCLKSELVIKTVLTLSLGDQTVCERQ